MSMSPRDLVARAEDEIDRRGVDVDDVRVVSTEGPGTTIRIVAEDAPDETDQVGVQVDRPDHPMGQNMFSDALRNALDQIEAYYSDDDTATTDDSTADTETPTQTDDGFDPDEFREQVDATTKDDTVDVSSPRDSPTSVPAVNSQLQQGEVGSDATVGGTELTINVTLDEESFEELQAELDAWLDDVETRVEDVEARMERIEDTLGTLGSLGDEK